METLEYLGNVASYLFLLILLIAGSFFLEKSAFFGIRFTETLRTEEKAFPLAVLAFSSLAFAVSGYIISGLGLAAVGLVGGLFAAPSIFTIFIALIGLSPLAYEHRNEIGIVAVIVLAIITFIMFVVKFWSYKF